ncbi:C2 domain-containing protein [Cryptococcus deuterogattii MMRL2647]|nr:C2 domain-containing protein [Cryptococcus deuterogattii MMRL2647]
MSQPPPLPPRKPSPLRQAITGTPGAALPTSPPLPSRPTSSISRDTPPPLIHTSEPVVITASEGTPQPSEEVPRVQVAITPVSSDDERYTSNVLEQASQRLFNASNGQSIVSGARKLDVEPKTAAGNGLANNVPINKGRPSSTNPLVSSPNKDIAGGATLNRNTSHIPLTLSLLKQVPSSGLKDLPAMRSTQWAIFTTILVLLAHCGLPLAWLIVTAFGSYYLITQLDGFVPPPTQEESIQEQKEKIMQTEDGVEAVGWVNHALYALFPLISTDVLTPFVDLLEDALSEEVPSIVTSVRLTSPALGSQPLVLTSLRPMSDEEWFASLSSPVTKSDQNSSKTLPSPAYKVPASPSPESLKRGRHGCQTPSTNSSNLIDLCKPLNQPSPTCSGSDAEIQDEVQKRRKRDRLLHKITHRVPYSPSTDHPNPPHSPETDTTQQNQPQSQSGDCLEDETDTFDGPRLHGGWDEAIGEEDPDAGQYVNYQVGFEYKRGEEAMQKGRGLHCLAYIGIGVKGLGKAEIPVYIDVLYIKGIINMRLLLSPTPPFITTGSFTLPSMPEYDISANPLKKGAFNAMNLPLMKPYVKASFKSVLSSFLHPHSYTLDIDRLLLGAESSSRTEHIGVLHIIFHGARDLPKADTMGSCDPYLKVGFEKAKKVMFSTRTIGRSRNPLWEEECFSADAIKAGEGFRICANDSDRFSADDTLGVVLLDLAELIDSCRQGMTHRVDHFVADRAAKNTSGTLAWSVEFCPLWQMSPQETKERLEQARMEKEKCEPPKGAKEPWWVRWMKDMIPGEDGWETERIKRRAETKEWLCGGKEREVWEAEVGASEERPSGILQFHIHQCLDLEVESTAGTYTTQPQRPAGGPPALGHVTDRSANEISDPPSAYCEVHLNDKLVYKTRTKEVTPMPYYNAVSERFVRDWTKGKIVFVVRDARDREHDPILGLVVINLHDILKETSQITRWFPLTAGLGWGRIRLSLLWKSLEMSIPRGISGYEVGTVQIKNLVFTSADDRNDDLRVIIRTDSDTLKVRLVGGENGNSSTVPTGSPSSSRFSTPPSSSEQYTFPASTHPVLAIMYRHSCSIHMSIQSSKAKRRVLGKRKLLGVGVIRLNDVPDGQGSRRVGVWEGVKGESNDWDQGFEGMADTPLDEDSGEMLSTPDIAAVDKSLSPNSHPDSLALSRVRTSLSKRSSLSIASSPRSLPGQRGLIGYIDVSWVLAPGISATHRKLAKHDLRFAKVFEAWELARDEHDIVHEMVNEDSGSDSENEEDENSGEQEFVHLQENDMEDMSPRRAHSHALHKQHKGLFQLKIARTGKFVKDKLSAKVYNAANHGNSGVQEGYGRTRGADLEVEKEGLSKL